MIAGVHRQAHHRIEHVSQHPAIDGHRAAATAMMVLYVQHQASAARLGVEHAHAHPLEKRGLVPGAGVCQKRARLEALGRGRKLRARGIVRARHGRVPHLS